MDATSSLGDLCPHCRAPTLPVEDPYSTPSAKVDAVSEEPSGPRLHVVLDNVRSLSNVGTIFRTADGAGVRSIHLCGFTPTPDHPKLAKTALGSELHLPWQWHPDAVECVHALKSNGSTIWALEGGSEATPFFVALHQLRDAMPADLVLVGGHEVSGVDPHVLQLCDAVVRLPMRGSKGSLNVAIAMSVALYDIAYSRQLAGL